MICSALKYVSVACCILFVVDCPCLAQPYVHQVDAIPVNVLGLPLALPFAGGINSPTHQFVDIDGDGDKDLIVLDNDLAVDFYRNEGTRFNPDFKLRNGLIVLPAFSRWFLFVDYDGDGRIDLCTEDSTYSGIKLYKNTGTVESPLFVLLSSTLIDSAGNQLLAGANCIPVFADIDADGDLDLLSPNIIGTVNFYENVGSSTLPVYAFRTEFWQHVTIYGDTCTTSPARSSLHGAAVYSFADINGDGTLDMFIGDFFSMNLFHLCNNGTPQVPHIECCSLAFPPSQPVHTQGFNQASFVDIDSDGDLDLFIGVLGGITQRDGFWFYENSGNSTAPLFQLRTKNYLGMIDVGMNAHPAFVDIDADGDQDMFIGNLNGTISFFRNDGTPMLPSFTRIDTFYQNMSGGYSFIPAFVDIDNDGRKDLFIGKYDGRVSYYHNVGSPQSALFVAASSPVDTIRTTANAAPVFVDIDDDGDNDFFVGGSNGFLKFYRNDGSPSLFQPVLISASYQNITAGQNAIPAFLDSETDGDEDLFIGTSEGRIEFYRNTGTPDTAQFIRVTNAYGGTVPTQEASPSFVDIDGDGDYDLFMGVFKGGVHCYRNQVGSNPVQDEKMPASFFLAQNFPNPFNPGTTINYQLAVRSHVTLRVFDVLGREVATLVDETKDIGSYSATWNATGVSSGVYCCRLEMDGQMQTRKLVHVR